MEKSAVSSVDKFKYIGDKTGLDRFKQNEEDSYVNAFAVWKLSGDDKEYCRPMGLHWSDYTIEFAQFCQQPLAKRSLDIGYTLIKTFDKLNELLPTRKDGKTDDELLQDYGFSRDDVRDQKKWLPSPHHRYIRFCTSQPYATTRTLDQARVWGIMERDFDGVVCALYKSERESLRSEAEVVQIDNFWSNYSMNTSEISGLSLNLADVYPNVGGQWRKKYHMLNNNCIHYAIECWKKLGGNVSWDGIVDGHSTTSTKYNPCAPTDSSDSSDSACNSCISS